MFSEEEGQLIEDHLNFRDSLTQARYRQANLFGQNRTPELPSRVFSKTVLGLTSRGVDLETARFAAGTATMRLPNGSTDQTLDAALNVLREREAA